jgi:two-component system, NtrC family, response regulator AtoC
MWMRRELQTPLASGSDHPLKPAWRFGKFTSCSPAMGEAFELLRRFAATDVTLTLLGETGTGKDVLAHALHEESARAAGPFVVFDCGSIAANLAESELFGHERGSFTGAFATHVGAFERADGGTLFLDEIGELPIDLQPRLLRVLETRRVRRVGGSQERQLDVRVVAATNRQLRTEVSHGKFREDLYFRLAGAIVPVPPLRARFDDLPWLIRDLLRDLGPSDVIVSDAALCVLEAHEWPGNVRELKNALACALAFVEAKVLEPRHLRLMPRGDNEAGVELPYLGGQTLQHLERIAIRQTLTQTHGNKALAAKTLGVSVSTLYEKLKKYGS